jgi:serine/threonine-protein kinase
VLDFGIAKSDLLAGTKTRTGAVLGTPYYMSPEQVDGLPVDARSDLWSLGIVAFECATGTVPFDGDALGKLFVAILQQPLPRPSERAPELPPAFDDWFARAASRPPADRFQSAAEMAAALAISLGIEEEMVGSRVAPRSTRASMPDLRERAEARTLAAASATFGGQSTTHGGITTRGGGRRAILMSLAALAIGVAAVGLGARTLVGARPTPAPVAAAPGAEVVDAKGAPPAATLPAPAVEPGPATVEAVAATSASSRASGDAAAPAATGAAPASPAAGKPAPAAAPRPPASAARTAPPAAAPPAPAKAPAAPAPTPARDFGF